MSSFIYHIHPVLKNVCMFRNYCCVCMSRRSHSSIDSVSLCCKNNCYNMSKIMQKEGEIPAVESEARNLISNNFERKEYPSIIEHVYNFCNFLPIQILKMFRSPIFPQSSGKSRVIKGDRKQRRTSNCI